MPAKDRLHEKNIASNGQEMEIIRYKDSNDIDVWFKDVTVVTGKKYTAFLKGNIRNPNQLKGSIKGERIQNRYNRWMEVIGYRNANDMTVRFDDGVILEHCHKTTFRNGGILHPDDTLEKKRIGETSTSSEGFPIRIIAYYGKDDVTIEFEDGTRREGVSYVRFKNGTVAKKRKDRRSTKYVKAPLHVGSKKTARNGQTMEVIEVIASNDLTVRFSDGTVVPHVTSGNFRTGYVGNPNYSVHDRNVARIREEIIGKWRMARNGMYMTVISYRKEVDCDILFEDGTLVPHRCHSSFKKGSIANPNFRSFPVRFGNVTFLKKAFFDGEQYYLYSNGEDRDIGTFQQVKALFPEEFPDTGFSSQVV